MVIKVARRTVLRELQLDADRAVCMTVVNHIEGNVLRVRCVPYRQYARLTWCATGRRQESRREESMVPGATSAKEGARVGVAHPLVKETVCFNRSADPFGHALLMW